MNYSKILNSGAKEVIVCDNFDFMKGEEYINIKKEYRPTCIIYNCYVGNKTDLYISNELLYKIKFNYLHKAIVYDSCGNIIGKIDGRDRDWTYDGTYGNVNVSIFDFPSLNDKGMDTRVKIETQRGSPVMNYKSEKPKPVGFFSHTLKFEYLSKHMRTSASNFKLYREDEMNVEHTTMVSCKLKKRRRYHCVTNLNKLHAFIIFCIKNWSV